MKLTKTKIILLLILTMAILILPSKVFAGTYGSLTFEIDSNTKKITITDCEETAKSVEIKEFINGYEVTSIAREAFLDCTSLKSVTIPNTIETIGGNAFENCSSLTSVTIPNSVTSIGNHAFEGCTNLRSVSLSSKITEIPEGMFLNCSKLNNVTIPNSVTKIAGDDLVFFGRLDSGAFENCTSLTSINIPSSVKEIDGWAFWGCTALTNITIPSTVTEIQRGIFYGCTGLKTANLYNNKISQDMFNGCTNLLTVNTTNNIATIEASAFKNCSKLQNFVVSNKVTEIPNEVFKGCTSLKQVTIPLAVEKFGDSVFEDTSADLVVLVVKGSEAEMYLMNNDVKYKTYTIAISSCTIGGISNKVYTGKAITQSPNITYGASTLTNGTDYTLSYTNNVNIGTATIVITGKGKFNGTISKTFKITERPITLTTISGIKDKEYTGKSITQAIVVKDGSVTLKNGTDYTVTYNDNINVGKAKVIITGKGKYNGTITKTFKINPKGTKLKKLKAGKKQFKVKWKKQKTQTTGYQIQYSTNKKFKNGNKKVKIKKNKITSSIIKKLKAKKKYYVRIRTYKNVNGKTYYSSWSKVKNITTKK